jgi:uncharacterized protein
MITALTIYPIKGCQGIALDQAYALSEGLAIKLANGEFLHDREFMVVDSAGNFLTQREVAHLATIKVVITADGLLLSAPGHENLHLALNGKKRTRDVLVWNFSGSGLDMGPIALGWFTKVLGRPAALVQFNRDVARDCKPLGSMASTTFFADSFGYLLIGAASVVDLEERLRSHHQDSSLELPANRFRANIVLDDLDAYEEDFLRTASVRGLTFEVVSKCVRCNVPGIDQISGEIQVAAPTSLLDTFRLDEALGGSTIGVNAILLPKPDRNAQHSAPDQIIKVGDDLTFEHNF